MTENGDQVALTARFHAQHAETVFLVVECDPLDQASQDDEHGRDDIADLNLTGALR